MLERDRVSVQPHRPLGGHGGGLGYLSLAAGGRVKQGVDRRERFVIPFHQSFAPPFSDKIPSETIVVSRWRF